MRLKHFAIISILIVSCKQTQEKQKEILPPVFDKEFSLDMSVKFENVRDVAYGYSFSYPISFVEVMDTVGILDSFTFFSQDRLTKIKFFVESGLEIGKDKNEKDEIEKNLFKHYFDSLEHGKHSFTKNAKMIKSAYAFKRYTSDEPANFMLLGERETTEFIMKSELSEIPISGNLTFKNFTMEYPKAEKNYFRPIALEIAKDFGH
jgi:hypothetical protein